MPEHDLNQMPQLQEPLLDRARRYWRQHLPQEFNRLNEAGELDYHLAIRVSQYEAQFGRLIEQGMDPAQAEELTVEILFPQEEPDLDQQPEFEPYHQEPDEVGKLPGFLPPGMILASDPRLKPHFKLTGLVTGLKNPNSGRRRKVNRKLRKRGRVRRRRNRPPAK